MKATTLSLGILFALVSLAAGAPSMVAPAARAQDSEELRQRYAETLEELRAKISTALPKVRERRKAAYQEARAKERAAEEAVNAAQKQLDEIGSARGLVGHAKGKWIGGADKGIAQAKNKLEKATTPAERAAAKEELAHWEKNREDGVQALEERQAKLDSLVREEPRRKKNLEAARRACAVAEGRTLDAVDRLGLERFLAKDRLDARLAEFVVLFEATPAGLAEFAMQGKEHLALVERLLADSDLMLQMVVADGARNGAYGQAMKIYADIQEASRKAGTGALQRLALAIALEHAVPVEQRNPTGLAAAPEVVDPVQRYLHYEEAFLANALDPGFAGLSVWDYRMVVDGNEPDETLAWGRQMLSNYRPDHVYTKDHRWRYVESVRTDIRYGSQDNKLDRPDLQFFQNILMNGGICGRRAFFGRFILRAHGVPTTARPQRGHAALARWSPDGWVVCLGGGWGAGWTKTRYGQDRDFLATTQAREHEDAYLKIKRAQWVGDVVGEPRVFGLLSGKPAFWYAVALDRQRALLDDAKVVALAAVGEELGEANESHVEYAVEAATLTEEDRRVVVDREGVITIPAVATSEPTRSTGKIIFMPSNLGGKQLHYGRNGGAQSFEYTFDAPAAGRYGLTARVVTPSWKQHLSITVNGAAGAVDLALPHTVGMWQTTPPVEVELALGRNVLRFAHRSEGYSKGFSIRDFTLTPTR
ncbi:MAG: hypothetical protein GY711_11255 [bacterium]|nr:hypothetical protein [bacterium]